MKVFGVVGWKNSGKTTLVENLVCELVGRGYSVSTVKHAHHNFDVDQKGTDSFKHRSAGASEVAIVSENRVALMQELRGAPEPGLAEILRRLTPCDFVIVEGFKKLDHPKVETVSTASLAEETSLWPDDATICAVVTDTEIPDGHKPVIKPGDIKAVADLVEEMALSTDELS